MEVDGQNVKDVFSIQPSGLLSETVAQCQPYLDKLYDSDPDTVFKGIKEMKNLVIGNNRRKTNFIVLGVVPRLEYLIQEPDVQMMIKIEAAIVLGSLAKGTETNIQSLIHNNVVETMCSCLSTDELKLYEACIRCLRTIVASSHSARKVLFYNSNAVIPQMLHNINKSTCTQECTCEILQHCCKLREHQDLLLSLDIIRILANLLDLPFKRLKVKVMLTLAVVCFKNVAACNQCMSVQTEGSGKSIVEILIELLSQKHPNQVQLCSARCLSYMFRAGVLTVNSWDGIVVRKVVPCLVRMCDESCSFEERIDGAETLAYITEVDPPLQRLAYVCEHFPRKLEAYFKYPVMGDVKNPIENAKFKHALKFKGGLHKTGFLAYASLLSNDEDIRKQVATGTLISTVAESISSSDSEICVAALKCLLSLSRSIHLLRTIFQDVGVCKALLKLMHDGKEDLEIVKALSSILCNMTLDFCPSKDQLQSACVVDFLVKWIATEDLKLNSIWCLMNMSFQSDTQFKLTVLEKLGFDLIQNLATDGDVNIILRTLGLLRNICYGCDDTVLSMHGVQIIQVCKHVLNVFAAAGIGNPTLCAQYECIRAHAVCVLGCIASADEKCHIQQHLQEEVDLIQQVIGFLSHFDTDLQLAAVTFLNNFIHNESTASTDRHSLLLERGVLNGLQQLQTTNDSCLYNKVEDTLQRLHMSKM